MAQLSEKTADESIQFVASVSVGRRFTCHWFDASNPGGRIWTGTVSSIAADKKTMLVKYDNIEMLLPFPPVEAKVHHSFPNVENITSRILVRRHSFLH